MFVSVVIPVFNDPRLEACLEALARQALPRDRFEVIVVDNGSEAPQRELVERYDFARFAEEPKPGSFAARNTALPLTRGEVLAFTDADCVPDPEWLSAGLAALEAAGGNALIGGRVDVFPEVAGAPRTLELLDIALAFDQRRTIERGGYAVTANLIAPRSAFDTVGDFNEALLSGSDGEWCQRAGEHGLPIHYCHEAAVAHPARASLVEVIRKRRRVVGGRKTRNQGRTAFGFLRTVARNLLPDFDQIVRGGRKLRECGYGPWSRCKLAGAVAALHYIGLFEHVRLRLGGSAER